MASDAVMAQILAEKKSEISNNINNANNNNNAIDSNNF